jgi:hypothetical protein
MGLLEVGELRLGGRTEEGVQAVEEGLARGILGEGAGQLGVLSALETSARRGSRLLAHGSPA